MKPFPASSLKPFFRLLHMLGLSVLVGILVLNMTIKGGTSQACAVCKFQRRRCSKSCPLAPHFPADQQKTFQEAHSLFGVSKIKSILKQVHSEQHEEAIKSIKYESEMRARFPVHGCLGVIWQLQFQMQQVQEELRHVRAWLAFYKDQQHDPAPNLGLTWQLQDDLPPYHQPQSNSIDAIGIPMNEFLVNGGAFVQANNDTTKAYLNNYGQHQAMAAQSQLFVSQGYPIQREMDVPYDYDDIAFDTVVDDRESYIDSKDATKSSAESSLRDMTQTSERVTDGELKNAAAYFSLTNVR